MGICKNGKTTEKNGYWEVVYNLEVTDRENIGWDDKKKSRG